MNKATSLRKESGIKTSSGRKGAGYEKEKLTNLKLVSSSEPKVVQTLFEANHTVRRNGTVIESSVRMMYKNVSSIENDNPIIKFFTAKSSTGKSYNEYKLQYLANGITRDWDAAYDCVIDAVINSSKTYVENNAERLKAIKDYEEQIATNPELKSSLKKPRVASVYTYLYRAVINRCLSWLKEPAQRDRILVPNEDGSDSNNLENINAYTQLDGMDLSNEEEKFLESIKVKVLNHKQLELVSLVESGYSEEVIMKGMGYTSTSLFRKDKSIALKKYEDEIMSTVKKYETELTVEEKAKVSRAKEREYRIEVLNETFEEFKDLYGFVYQAYLTNNDIAIEDFTPQELLELLKAEQWDEEFTKPLEDAINNYYKTCNYRVLTKHSIEEYYKKECKNTLTYGTVKREYYEEKYAASLITHERLGLSYN
jgi:hypothetical protein